MSDYPHLHVRTVYSPMQGLVKLETLAKREVACVTDTTLWAAARLAKMRKKGQTIYGLEIVPEGYAGHVVLLAEDMDGWRTLCAVGRDGLKMGQALAGVHLLTGGADGILVKGKGGEWQGELLGKLRAMVPEGKLWVELAPTQGERWVELWNLANEHDLPVVATGDVSYAERESRQAWHVMRAIGERRRLQRGGAWEAQEGPLGAEGVAEQGEGVERRCWGHLASAAEMSQFFTRCPAALRAAADLAARCQVKLRLGVVALPDYVADDGRKLDAAGQVGELRRQAEEGLRERLDGKAGDLSEYWTRLAFELDVIAGTGFAGYFLIYADFVRWGKTNGVPFGTGRGSAAGSLVVWALGITKCDPILHGLLFERFLNPERCFPGWTLVLTKRGEIPISEVTTEDMVWTRGGWRYVLSKMANEVDEDLTEIQYAIDGKIKSLTATKNHNVFQSQSCYLNRVSIDKLEVGDALAKKTSSLCVQGMPEGYVHASITSKGVLLQDMYAKRACCREEGLHLSCMQKGILGLRLQKFNILLKSLQAQQARGEASTQCRSRSCKHAAPKTLRTVRKGLQTNYSHAASVFSSMHWCKVGQSCALFVSNASTSKNCATVEIENNYPEAVPGMQERIFPTERQAENLFSPMWKSDGRQRGFFVREQGVQRRHSATCKIVTGSRFCTRVQEDGIYGYIRTASVLNGRWPVLQTRFLDRGDANLCRVEGLDQRQKCSQSEFCCCRIDWQKNQVIDAKGFFGVCRNQRRFARIEVGTKGGWAFQGVQKRRQGLSSVRNCVQKSNHQIKNNLWSVVCKQNEKDSGRRFWEEALIINKRHVKYTGLVWNLSIDEDHEYFAEGVLVANCSWPDIDIDICKRRRGDVVKYLSDRYGRDSVGRIINFKVLVGKTALKDVGRAFGIGYHRLNALTAGVPMTVKGKTPKLAWMITEVQALREAVATDSELARVVKVALELEGCIRESGVHASGIVVSRGPLADWVPTIHAKGGELCSAWDMREAEDAGLVKLDLLGLSTVTMIDLAERMAGVKVDQSLNDAGTFALMGRGDTHGVFQMGKGGFRRMLRELKPDRFGDVVAAGALYRPGPIQGGMVKAYCRRKHGLEKVVYIHPLLESVTRDTYACITYQEQVMSSARVLAGYSLGEADILRRAMGKKKPEEMRAQRAKFVDGAVRLGTCEAAQASEIFDLIDHFSGYGFNVSHSTAYGMLSYYTGWLKRHHPLAFYASLLSILTEEADSYVKIAETVYDMHEHNVRVLPPDVNLSGADFAPEGTAVRYGLRGLRGLGKAAALAIAATQPFASLADLLTRVKLGKRDLTALVGSGALDALLAHESRTRAHALRCLPDLLAWCKAAHAKPKVKRVTKRKPTKQLDLLEVT